VNGNWVQGAFFGSRLFEFTAGMVLGVWHQRDPLDTERRLFGAPALVAGVVLYALGLASYANIVTYVATDALVGSGLFLLLAHLAHACARRPRLGLILAQVGAYSYGLYLVHQPYAIYFAILVRSWPMPAAVAAFLPVLAVLTSVCMALERLVNGATTWLLAPRPARAAAEAGVGPGPH
jgi:peptidoglycan/LPS O-acetylase OafA/YrhL